MTTSLDSPKRHGFCKRVWLRIQAQWRGEPLDRRSVRHDERGFTVEWSGVDDVVPQTRVVRWQEVKRVEAFKRDRLTVDDICVGIVFADDAWIEVDEEMDGFDNFINALPSHLHGCLPSDLWWGTVMLPPFATNQTVLWIRANSDAV